MLQDPGKDKPRTEAKALLKQAWKRPTKKADRDKLRQDRIAAAREEMGRVTDSPGIQG